MKGTVLLIFSKDKVRRQENGNYIFLPTLGVWEVTLRAPPQSLNSKIMNHCNIDFNFLE